MAHKNDRVGLDNANSGFVELWPTTLLRRQLPDNEAANLALTELILKLEKARAQQQLRGSSHASQTDLSTDYLSQDLLQIDEPVMAWLKACINKTVADYFKQRGHNYKIDWGLQAWANINRRGDYHNLHNHPHAYLSGTYYVSMPEISSMDASSRHDLNPGAISFFDPRAQANMLAIKGDAQVDPEYRLQPEAGLMLLWPSFLHHLVHPNFSDQPRISISFNVVLKWRDEYLPDQD